MGIPLGDDRMNIYQAALAMSIVLLFAGCSDEQSPGKTGAEAPEVSVTPSDTGRTNETLTGNSGTKSSIHTRSGQVLFEIDGNRVRSRMGQVMYEIDGNRIKSRSGQTVCTIDGNRIRSRMGQTNYEIDGNRIKARNGQVVCTIDGNRIRSRMGQPIFTIKGGVPLKTIALLIGAGALNVDQ